MLRDCGLPEAWRGQRQWRILEAGFGPGLNFLCSWKAWRDDPERPGMLHFVSIEARPVQAADIARVAAARPQLQPLAAELIAQWFGLAPGTHRLSFDEGRVLLTLFIGNVRDALRQQVFCADAIHLDGSNADGNPGAWEPSALKAIARRCRRATTITIATAAGPVTSAMRHALAEAGFVMDDDAALGGMQDCLRGRFDPAWKPKSVPPAGHAAPGRAVIIGAGLAGSAAAASLARRGWQVTVLEAATQPASGASGLPVGLLAPNHSPDDNLLSRLSRCGVRMTLDEARRLLAEGNDWAPTGVLERKFEEPARARSTTRGPGEGMHAWSRKADAGVLEQAGLDANCACVWHERAAWIKPSALVRAWLAQPGVEWRAGVSVGEVLRSGATWRVRGRVQGRDREFIAQADLVVIAAAVNSMQLVGERIATHPVRGQVTWGTQQQPAAAAFPMNGNGHFIPHVPTPEGLAWFCGSTFGPGESDLTARAADDAFNLERLRALAPGAAPTIAAELAAGSLRAWTGVRCASNDRRPLLGEIEPGLWVSTAMGSRGLTFAALCGELLAARVHAEPFPLDLRLARALDTTR